MRAPYTQLYVHIIWSTWDRLPLISTNIENKLYSAIAAKCRELKCIPLTIGGIEDHLHILIRLHPPISVAELVKQIKGSSSHFMTHVIAPGEFFKWQGGYGAFTIRKDDVDGIKIYIANQKQHHESGDISTEWEGEFNGD